MPALAAALLLIGAPQLNFWGRQVMLDVPAYAILIWSAIFLIRYANSRAPYALYAAVVFAVAAIGTKYNAVFFLVVIGTGGKRPVTAACLYS